MSKQTSGTARAEPRPAAANEIVATRLIDAPREHVFHAWFDSKNISNWWGPRGFSTTTFSMDARPGGEWRHVMHGPDGVNYDNLVVYREIVEPERIVYDHVSPPQFELTATFSDEQGKTRVHIRMVFGTVEERDRIAKAGAEAGLFDLVERLEEQMTGGVLEDKPFVISQEVDAPLDRVFQVWTQLEHLKQWFGPKGFTMPQATLDLKPGGTFHYQLVAPNGMELWGKFLYREISPPRKLVWVNMFSDAEGGQTRHPLSPNWPAAMLTTVSFSAVDGGRTRITIFWSPIEPSDEERQTFLTGFDSMRMGWGGTFEQLVAYLRKGQA